MAKRASKMAKKAKKKGLAKSKMANIQTLKKIKRKEYTPKERRAKLDAKREKKKQTYAELYERKQRELRNQAAFEDEEELYPTTEVTGDDMMAMMEPEELCYLVEQNKDLPLEDDEQIDAEKTQPSGEDTEKSYELKERSFNRYGNDVKVLLPIKTKKGLIERYGSRADELEKDENGKVIRKKLKDDTTEVKEKKADGEKKKTKKEPVQKTVVELMAERREMLKRKKVAIGCLSINFLQQPQERLHCLSTLLHMMEEKDPSISVTVRKYAIVSLLEVFHKVIPSYHLEPHDLTGKLKKETKDVYLYENFILKSYQTYLKGVEKCLKEEANYKGDSNPVKQLGMIALKSMGELLAKHNHFTYTNNIIAAMLPYLNSKDDEKCQMVFSYFTNFMKGDIHGDISLEIVKRLDHFIRKREFKIRVECISVFLSLRIKNIKSLDDELEAKNKAKKKLTHTEKLMRKLVEEKKQKKSKKEAKKFKKFRKLEEQRKEHVMARNEQVRSTQHTQIIEIVFGLYFHVLKRRPNKELNAVVLEGLAKFSHLVNIEFFSDLLNVLGKLMEEGTLNFRESLHCTQTVFAILSDQGEALKLDPRRFYTYLYANLFHLCLGISQDDTRSALQSVMQMLVLFRRRVSAARAEAFIKRLASLCLTLVHNGAIATLGTVRYIMLAHPSSEVLLEIDSEVVGGRFNSEVNEPEHCNAAASVLWELQVLNRHYHSTVQQFAQHLAIKSPLQGEGQLPPLLGKRAVEDLFDDFDPSEMKFNPAVPNPSNLSTKMYSKAKNNAKRQKTDQWSTQYMNRQVESLFGETNCFEIPKSVSAKENGIKKNTDVDLNFYSGMLPNMDLSNIKTSIVSKFEDATASLINEST